RLYTDNDPVAAQAYQEAHKALFAITNHGFVPARALYASVATIVPSPGRDLTKLTGFDDPYTEIGQALARGEPVHIPLRRSRKRDDPALAWATDPLTFEFWSIEGSDHAWARRQKATRGLPGNVPIDIFLMALGLQMTDVSLGPLKFIKQPRDFDLWNTEDGAMLMYVGHARLCLFGTAVDEIGDIAPSSDFGIAMA
ncbi:MAG: hypothetical protein K8S25_04540, partial [Alphaproteobacteria bacterium]|nr:hypothetical protein [Alphaproteobacteria bacterium]